MREETKTNGNAEIHNNGNAAEIPIAMQFAQSFLETQSYKKSYQGLMNIPAQPLHRSMTEAQRKSTKTSYKSNFTLLTPYQGA